MATKEEIQALLEEHDVPDSAIQTVVSELDSSSLRKKLGELEGRWKSEAEPAISYKQRHETLPKRVEAFKRVGIDYEAQPPYARKVLDTLDAEKLDNLEEVAGFVKAEGFEAKVQPDQSTDTPPNAQAVVNQGLTGGIPPNVDADKEAAFNRDMDAAQTEAEGIEVLRKHGRLAQGA